MLKSVTDVNPNPLAFDDLANILATVSVQFGENNGDMSQVVIEYKRLFNQAMGVPPNYNEVTELTGEGKSANDQNAGRGAWLLRNIASVDVQAVHSEVSIPLLSFLASKLQCEMVAEDELQARLHSLNKSGKRLPKLGILGIQDRSVVVVQAISSSNLAPSRDLFRLRIFDDPVLKGTSLRALHIGYWSVKSAFPKLDVKPWVLVTHKDRPENFELYQPRINKGMADSVVLTKDLVVDASYRYQHQIDENRDALWQLSKKLDNPLFEGLPPCRGGRTLGTLAAIAQRQLESSDLIEWKECEVGELYRRTFDYHVSRDKIRHDIDDRLISQWFMKPRESIRYLTLFGLSRYLYCLAKYTTCGISDPDEVLEQCIQHCAKIRALYN
ncbi:hypothetical protein M4951_14380 [Blastopirellula sp. J2-11]|uniref:hypothetical protein n=1 Tax=Blastopirellula sp. J2-11 TaxID=2943192 RepID=UPI0021C7FDA2|nr:hypothetical protein [Blastopirellula sp. J2-11]UUO04578.1 hypothetical protein M4951_14380 [Blastopirellula sp. J2-11]